MLPLRDDVESVADLYADVFVLRRVVDAVFADKLLIAFVVLLVKTNRAGGQRHPEFVLLRIPKLNIHADLFLDRLAGIVVIRVVIALTVQHELLLHIKARSLQQRHLLRFVIANAGRSLQRIQVIFEEALLLKLGFAFHRLPGHPASHIVGSLIRDSIHVAGHQLQTRVFKRSSARISQRDPALQIALRIVGVDQQNVIRAPVHARRQIARLDGLRSAFAILKIPNQRRRRDQVLGKIGKTHFGYVGRVDYDLAIDAPDLPAIVRQQSRPNRLESFSVVRVAPQHQSDFPAYELVQ